MSITTNITTRPYAPSMTQAPITEAYLDRMKRRDDPEDTSVCEHNIDLHEQRCPSCSVFDPAALKHAAEKNRG